MYTGEGHEWLSDLRQLGFYWVWRVSHTTIVLVGSVLAVADGIAALFQGNAVAVVTLKLFRCTFCKHALSLAGAFNIGYTFLPRQWTELCYRDRVSNIVKFYHKNHKSEIFVQNHQDLNWRQHVRLTTKDTNIYRSFF